jgi:hypothetical protein
MRSVRTEIEIEREPARVWEVLSALDAWPTWTDVFPSMRAEPRVGGRVRFRIRIDGLPPLPISAEMRVFRERDTLAWGGGPPGLFAGHHYFEIVPAGEGRTKVMHGEDFSGAIAELVMKGGVADRLVRTYEKVNRQLKARVEGG